MAFWNKNTISKTDIQDVRNLFETFNAMSGDKRLDAALIENFKQRNFFGPANKLEALKVAAVYGCTRVISGGIGQMPFVVKGQPETQAMLNSPNPAFSGSQFRTWIANNILLEGNAYAAIERRGARPQTIIPLDPYYYTTTPRYVNGAVVYDVRGSANPNAPQLNETIRSEDMIHITSDTFNGLKGMSILETGASTAVKLESMMSKYSYQHFEKGALQDYMLSTPDAKHKDRVEKIQEDWEEKIAKGVDAMNKLVVVGRDVELKALTASFRDNQMIQSREFTIQDIARAFGVLSFMIGQEQRLSLIHI